MNFKIDLNIMCRDGIGREGRQEKRGEMISFCPSFPPGQSHLNGILYTKMYIFWIPHVLLILHIVLIIINYCSYRPRLVTNDNFIWFNITHRNQRLIPQICTIKKGPYGCFNYVWWGTRNLEAIWCPCWYIIIRFYSYKNDVYKIIY